MEGPAAVSAHREAAEVGAAGFSRGTRVPSLATKNRARTGSAPVVARGKLWGTERRFRSLDCQGTVLQRAALEQRGNYETQSKVKFGNRDSPWERAVTAWTPVLKGWGLLGPVYLGRCPRTGVGRRAECLQLVLPSFSQ